jgi:hypothetical protein
MIRYILSIAFLVQVSFACYSQCGANDQYGCGITGPSVVCVGKQVNFGSSCNYNFNKYTWNVNGQTGTLANFSFTFTTPGEYCVELTVACVREGGGRDEELEECEVHGEQVSYKQITVYSSPVTPIVEISPAATVCGSQTLTLTVTNPQAGLDYVWTLAGQTIGTGTSVSHLFESSASVTVTASVPNESACSASASRSIQVINTDLLPAVESLSYHRTFLQATGTGSASTYYWQTSANGENTSRVATSSFEVTTTGRYFLRRLSGSCWAPARYIDVTVSTSPPTAELGVAKYRGYNFVSLTNTTKDFIYQYADYFFVSSASGTEITKELKATGNYIYTSGSYFVRGRDRETGTWGDAVDVQLTVEPRGENEYHWIYTQAFDGTSETIPYAETKSYIDENGKTLQTQTKTHTADRGNFIFTSVELLDHLNRPVGASLPAPIKSKEFQFAAVIMEDEAGNEFSAVNFDSETTRLNPDAVANTTEGTIGWYYSANNTYEEHVPVTQYPFSRIEFYDDGLGEVKRSSGVGEAMRLGQGHEIWNGTFPIYSELQDYLVKRLIVFPGASQPTSMYGRGIQKVARDQNGRFGISISDNAGKVLMTARPGTSSDFVLECTSQVRCSPIGGVWPQKQTFYLTHDQAISVTGSDFVIVNTITGDSYSAAALSLQTGFYRLEANGTSEVSLAYKNYFVDVSYKFYNDANQLISSISPNGYKEWQKAGASGSSTTPEERYLNIDKTTYSYNFRGWLLATTEVDAGTSKFQYRKDGKIRFSQNALQLQNEEAGATGKGKFSYTNYDGSGRPTESGEYIGTTLFASLSNVLEWNQQADYSMSEKTDWTETHYDYPDANFTQTGLQSLYKQEFVRNAVSWTRNENVKTWYSYDEFGRITWMAQKPIALPRVFVAVYQYDFLGNVLKVSNLSYNLSGSLLSQFHHYYEYDADKRLSKAYTSAGDDGSRKLRASYEYYLHGPLKRIELGDNLQGIDFVYNIHGWLTAINHPDRLQDPGGDSNDVFGMVLDYYESDLNNLYSSIDLQYDVFKNHGLPAHSLPVVASHQPLIRFYIPTASSEDLPSFNVKNYSAENPVYKKMIQALVPSTN